MYSVIDIGSNTIRLVVYRLDQGAIQPILNNKRPAGLAGYLDRNGCLNPEGVEKLVSVLSEFRQILDMLPDCPVFPFATASLRNIANTEEVLDRVREACGMEIRVLSGREEALLDHRGVMRSMNPHSGLLVDVGGGSTELVLFREGEIQAAESIPVGSLNLYNRFVDQIVPTKKELKEMKKEVRRMLRRVLPSTGTYDAQPMWGVGGTARGALALARHMGAAERDGREYGCGVWKEILEQAEESPKKLSRRILKLSPDRIHTMVPGILILSVVAESYGSRTVVTSPYGVREGYLSLMLEERGIAHV